MPIFNVCGTNYQYPNVGEKPWGTIHIAWAAAVSSCVTALNTQVSQIAANQFISPMLADGDIIIQDVGIPTRLPIGAVGQVLTVGVSNLPEWGAVVGTGDVVGPAGAVDENIAVYDGVTGKLLKDGGITVAAILAQIAAVTPTAPNYDLSSSCGAFSTTSTTPVAVTNLSCTLTTTGGPVVLAIIGDGSATRSYISVAPAGANSSLASMDMYFLRGGTTIHREWWAPCDLDTGLGLDIAINPATLWTVDFPAAGTYTWTIEVEAGYSGQDLDIRQKKLLAYEIK